MPATFIEQELVGRRLIYTKMGLLLEYRCSFVSPVDGLLYHSGVVVDRVKTCGVLLGSAWSWKAGELVRAK